jgi:hypothetical protein
MIGVFVGFSRIHYRNAWFKKKNPPVKKSRQAALRGGI